MNITSPHTSDRNSFRSSSLRRFTRSAFLAAAVLCMAGHAHAWNRGGHMVVGALAYDQLAQTNTAALNEAVQVLNAHPANNTWQNEVAQSSSVNANKALFMLAAVFPDDARSGQFVSYNRPDWHYADFAYTPGQLPVDVLTTEPFGGQLLNTFNSNLQTYRNRNASLADRAVALSWLLHQGGDITQPLHVTSLVNLDFPSGDKGGNALYVRASSSSRSSTNLHKLWDDGLIGSSVKLSTAANLATQLRMMLPLVGPSPNINTAIREQAASSYALALKDVYRYGQLAYAKSASSSAPVLPSGYTQQEKIDADNQAMRASGLLTQLLSVLP